MDNSANTQSAQDVQQEQAQDDAQEQKTFTQEDVNKMMGEVRREARNKFKDYDELKEKAEKYTQLQEANKTEAEKIQERLTQLEKENTELKQRQEHLNLVNEVSQEKKVPAALLFGSTKEELESAADALIEWKGQQQITIPKDKGGATTTQAFSVKQIESIKDPVERARVRAENMGLYRN